MTNLQSQGALPVTLACIGVWAFATMLVYFRKGPYAYVPWQKDGLSMDSNHNPRDFDRDDRGTATGIPSPFSIDFGLAKKA